MLSHTPRWVAVAALVAVLSAALAAGCEIVPTATTTPPATPPPTEAPSLDISSPLPSDGTAPTTGADPSTAATTTLRVYYILGSLTGNPGLVPVLRTVPKTQAVGTAALMALLAGPSQAELAASPAMYTSVPIGTTLLGLRIENGVATVNFSIEFLSADVTQADRQRLAQVTYTLTQFASVTGVRFQIEGVPLTAFGVGGVNLNAPVVRAMFTSDLPAIFIDRPAWGGALGNPTRLTGTADVFEAQFNFRIIDAGGHSVADGPIKATCGTGCRGTFDATIPYTVAAAGWGTLEVYELSAANSSVVNLTSYPVFLSP